ncbi:alpha/beta hydrolase fold-3 domain-containing protein [Elsinoe ampelina]|uniref:Alpha/beta hydrolase fold-3 domain-containing protein n=1 Tax=Elsinoe ampelina TaxID=302913 RepID=A0A6A6GBA8_9PEZI|nr:alpha/beta hydrolase fold-3 domain-containing protein [Elsinoe ampelina]
MSVYDNAKAVLALSEPDPEYSQFILANKQPQLEFSYPLVQAVRQRTFAAEQQRTAKAIESGRLEECRTITMRDGFESEIRIHRPRVKPNDGSPLIVLAFGGGFVFGNVLQMGGTARILNDLYGATVVCISYRLAPEHPWPQSHEDAWDSLVWIAQHASSLGADANRGFVIGGASAGANISAVLAQRSLSDKLAVPLTGAWLNMPMIFKTAENVPEKYRPLYLSDEQNANVPGLLNKSALEYIRSAVKGNGFSAMFSPVNAERPHVGMPPVFIQACGMDVVRDDALVYERMLRDNGVKTKVVVYAGVPHGHQTLFPSLAKSKQAKFDTIEGIGELLGKTVSRTDVENAFIASAS